MAKNCHIPNAKPSSQEKSLWSSSNPDKNFSSTLFNFKIMRVVFIFISVVSLQLISKTRFVIQEGGGRKIAQKWSVVLGTRLKKFSLLIYFDVWSESELYEAKKSKMFGCYHSRNMTVDFSLSLSLSRPYSVGGICIKHIKHSAKTKIPKAPK